MGRTNREVPDVLRLVRDVEGIGGGGLHAEGQFEGLDPGVEARIVDGVADDVRLHPYISNWGMDSFSRSAAAIHSFIAGSASMAS